MVESVCNVGLLMKAGDWFLTIIASKFSSLPL